jgi:alpha-tubulin suppressor-like RCC1 family protein
VGFQETPKKINFPPSAGPIEKISVGLRHNLFLTKAGELYACGSGRYGQLGTGDTENRLTPYRITRAFPDGVGSIKEIGVGDFHSIFLSRRGEVYACGLGEYGQLGTGDNHNRLTPVKIILPPDSALIKEIVVGHLNNMF